MSNQYPENYIWYTLWFMKLKDSENEIVGTLSFKGIDDKGIVEIGYGINEGYENKGYMTEAVTAMAKWACNKIHEAGGLAFFCHPFWSPRCYNVSKDFADILFDEIDFEKLPNQFVIKCTHDSGGVVICKDKSFDKIRKKNEPSGLFQGQPIFLTILI